MDLQKYDESINSVSHRVSRVYENVLETRLPGKDPILDTFETLRAALEELQVAGEELRRQSDALTARRSQDETERLYYRSLFESGPDCYLFTDGLPEARREDDFLDQLRYTRPVASLVPDLLPPLLRTVLVPCCLLILICILRS